MFSNLISSEPTAFLIAFLSLSVLALYLFIRSQKVAARMKHVTTQCEQLQTELNSERIISLAHCFDLVLELEGCSLFFAFLEGS